MRLIVDANILFAALIKDGATAELMISDKIELFAPEFIFVEFAKYEKVILDKTHRSKEEFKTFLELLKEQITIVPKKKILPFMDKAEKISPDPKDIVYIALALAFKCNLWSNDKELKEIQENISILLTTEIIKRTKFLNY